MLLKWKRAGARHSPPSCRRKCWPPEPNEMGTNDTKEVRVRVLFFGAARDAVGHDELELRLEPRSNVTSVFKQLLADYPALDRFGSSLLFAVNQEYALPDREISDGDELAILPPVSGGSRARSVDVSS